MLVLNHRGLVAGLVLAGAMLSMQLFAADAGDAVQQCVQAQASSVRGVVIKKSYWEPGHEALRVDLECVSISAVADAINAIQKASCGTSELRSTKDGPGGAPVYATIHVVPFRATVPPPTVAPSARQDGLDPWFSYADADSRTEAGHHYAVEVFSSNALRESIAYCTCLTDGTADSATAHLTYVFRVGASGAVREAHFDNPQTRFKVCLAAQMVKRSLPAPPKPDFWFAARMAGNIGEYLEQCQSR